MGVLFSKNAVYLSFGENSVNVTLTEVEDESKTLVKAGKPFPYSWRQGFKPYEHEFWGTDFRGEMSINNDFSAE